MAQHIPRLLMVEALQGGAEIAVTDEERLHHLRNVLRLAENDVAHLFNGNDGEWQAKVISVSKKGLVLKLVKQIHAAPLPAKQHIIMAFAPLKRTALEWAVEKLAELGVQELQPVLTDYTQNRAVNTERLDNIMVDAIEQCGSFTVPVLCDALALRDFLRSWDKTVPLYAALESAREQSPLFAPDRNAAKIGILIGPEGGWSEDEILLFKKHGFIKPVSLGTNILRAETAAIAAVSIAKIR